MATHGESALFHAEEIDPAQFFAGTVLVTAPHQDDGVLGCGATLARLRGGDPIHVVYATDGADSPAPVIRWRDSRPEGLGETRAREARQAMGKLGIPAANLHFLGYPDGKLNKRMPELREALQTLVDRIQPNHILTPFRYDRHPDHLALNRTVLDLYAPADSGGPRITEYFIYSQWKLLPRGDLRAYVRPGLLRQIDPAGVAHVKREALDSFKSQTTRFYAWQTRPNLTAQLLDEVSAAPEVFLRYDPCLAGASLFTSSRTWIRIAHRLEPALKKRKDHMVALSKRIVGRGMAENPPSKP